jgi:hypothetical protein
MEVIALGSSVGAPVPFINPTSTVGSENIDLTQIRFNRYHEANPHVYTMFVKFARQVKHIGLNKYSIWAVANRVRWHYEFEVKGDEKFKISNDFLSRYSRLIMQNESDLAGFFTTKRLASDAN